MAKNYEERLTVFIEINEWLRTTHHLLWIITSASITANLYMLTNCEDLFANKAKILLFGPIIFDIVVFLMVTSLIMISFEVGKLLENERKLTIENFKKASTFCWNYLGKGQKWEELLSTPWGLLNLVVTILLLLFWVSPFIKYLLFLFLLLIIFFLMFKIFSKKVGIKN